MTGLPQAGVILTGTPIAPVVINNSTRSILVVTLLEQDAAGRTRPHTYDMIGQLRNNPRAGIAPGSSFSDFQQQTTQIRDATGAPPPAPAQVFLDSVLFDDGVLVGPDKNNSFDAIAARLQAQQDLNAAVEAGAWSGLQEIANSQTRGLAAPVGSETFQRTYLQRVVSAATEMLRVRERSGDAEAFKLARSMAAYPKITRGPK